MSQSCQVRIGSVREVIHARREIRRFLTDQGLASPEAARFIAVMTELYESAAGWADQVEVAMRRTCRDNRPGIEGIIKGLDDYLPQFLSSIREGAPEAPGKWGSLREFLDDLAIDRDAAGHSELKLWKFL